MAFALRTPEERLTQLNKKQLQAIRKVYKNAYNNMSDRIERLNKGTFSGKVMESEFKKLKKELNEAYKEVGEQIKALTKSGATESADIAVQLANEFAEKIGVSVEGAYSYVPKEVVQSIVTGELYKGDWSLSKAIWGDLKQTQQDLQNIIAEGIAQNLPSPDIARAIQEYMNPDEKKGYDWLKEHPGTKTSIDYNAFRLSKTMISHAYQQAYEKTVEKNPFVEGIKWEVSNKHNVCDLCKKRAEQNDYGLGKGVYPKGKVPLDHPNGQCVLISVTPPLSEAADRLVAWRNGKNDPDMDKWYESMGLKKPTLKKVEEKPKKEKKATKKTSEKKGLTLEKSFKEILTGISKTYGKESEKEMKEFLKGLNHEAYELISKYDHLFNGFNTNLDRKSGGYYRRGYREIYLASFEDVSNSKNRNIRPPYFNFTHEFGHFIDDVCGKISGSEEYGRTFHELLKEDCKKLVKSKKITVWFEEVTKLELNKKYAQDILSVNAVGVQDIISGVYLNKARVPNSHSTAYWKRRGKEDMWKDVTSEAFANMHHAYCTKEGREAMEKLMPKSFEYFEKTMVPHLLEKR